MEPALRVETTVLPGRRIEIAAADLPEGTKVEVMVFVPETRAVRSVSALDFLDALPQGPRAFKTWDEYEKHLQQERDSWER